jgi:hypothetical protein
MPNGHLISVSIPVTEKKMVTGWNQGLTSGSEFANIGAVSLSGEKFSNLRKEDFL